MSNLCVMEEVEIDWWIVEGKEKIGGGRMQSAREVDRWTDRWWERRILKKLCRLSWTRRQQERSQSKQNQQITVNADIVQHTYTFFSFFPLLCHSLLAFSLRSIFPRALFSYPHTQSHTLSETQTLLNFLPQVKRWRRTKWYLCSAVHICVGGATRPELHVSSR